MSGDLAGEARAEHPMLALADDIDYVQGCWARWKQPGVVVDAQYREERERVDRVVEVWRDVPGLNFYPEAAEAYRRLALGYPLAARAAADERVDVEAVARVLAEHSSVGKRLLPGCRCGWVGSSHLAWAVDLARHQAEQIAALRPDAACPEIRDIGTADAGADR